MSVKIKKKAEDHPPLVVENAELGYSSWKDKIEARGSNRMVVVNGRVIKARTYHMNEKKRKKLLEEWHTTGVFPSPFSKGIYTYLINALANLGVNKILSFPEVREEMKRIMSEVKAGRVTAWEKFENRKRSDGKRMTSVRDRLMWQIKGLRKLSKTNSSFPAGEKLSQLGACIDVFFVPPVWTPSDKNRCCKDNSSAVYLRLNTHSVLPLNVMVQSVEMIEERYPIKGKTLGPKVGSVQ